MDGSYFWQLAIEYKMVRVKLLSFFASAVQSIWYFAHSIYRSVRKYIPIIVFLKPFSTSFVQDFRTGNIVFFEELWPWNEFERFVVFSNIRLKCEVNFFIRKSFTFLVALLLFSGFLVSILSKSFRSLGINSIVS